MVHTVGLRIFVVLLAVVHVIFSQQNGTPNSHVAYRNVERRSYMENVRLASYGPQMQPVQQPETTETRVIKHPDEKIVHHPSPIYVKRQPTYVTINHPDIVIEPNPVVYHKPAAVVRSPVIYKHLPRKIQYRQVVKHVVKPIERKIVLEEKQSPRICTHKTIGNRNQHILEPKYFLSQLSDGATTDAENVQYQQFNRGPRTNVVYQPEAISGSAETDGEVVDDTQYVPPLDIGQVYYKQSFPLNFAQ